MTTQMSELLLVPDKSDWRRFYGLMRAETGLDLDLYKPDQLRRRIIALAAAHMANSLDEFWDHIASDSARVQAFTDKLAINVSEFYRDPGKWQELIRAVQRLTERSPSLKCWSAGCSFGAEPYTLGILLDVHFPADHTILGTDIDLTALSQAAKGEFTETEMGGLPTEVRNFYFTFNPATKHWKAKVNLSKYMEFQEHNLLSDEFDSDYDLILCRNVVIYLKDSAKEDLYRKFFDALRPGGVLFTGGAERIYDFMEYGFESTLPFFYRKPLDVVCGSRIAQASPARSLERAARSAHSKVT